MKTDTAKEQQPIEQVYRIIDANCNRLREALRVIEEYFRFAITNADATKELKRLRHVLKEIERLFDRKQLLANRDTHSDPFGYEVQQEEKHRTSLRDLVIANFKRAQEASRVLEEYTKLTTVLESSALAKEIRFSLYALEKQTAAGDN